jgi:large subunit ribosomal protein L10
VIDGELFVGADHLNFLSSVKSKEQVLLELLMLLQVPASRFLMVLKMPGRKVIGMIEALANKLNT